MDPIVTGSLIAGGSALLGGVLGSKATSRANAVQVDLANRNIELQKEFAKNGIRWKVEDAIAAGIHPLYAVGAPAQSFSPVSVGNVPNTSISDTVRSMGQDISRSIQAGRTKEEQELSKLQLAAAKADLDGKLIDNQLRASQLKKLNAVTTSIPSNADNFIPGQGNSPLVTVKPSQRTASQPGRLAQEAGWRPDVSYSRTDTGLVPMVPESLSESLEDDIIGKLSWRFRNQLLPNFAPTGAPAKSQLPKGYTDWEYDFWTQEWRPIKGKSQTPFDRFRSYLKPYARKLKNFSRYGGDLY